MILSTTTLSAGYPGMPPVLSAIDFSLGQGAFAVLLGPNGIGKTTLLRCLSGAHKPSSGQVRYHGEVLTYQRRALAAHRSQVQLVLQNPDDQLFSADVYQDVAFGPLNQGLSAAEATTRVEEALQALGITRLAGRPTHQLSFGERKRVAIAGAVAMRPQVLLLDEPTAGLDPHGEELLIEALHTLHEVGTTLLISTHDVDLAAELATEVAILTANGLYQGDPVELLSDQALLTEAKVEMPWPLAVSAAAGWTPPERTRLGALTRLTQDYCGQRDE